MKASIAVTNRPNFVVDGLTLSGADYSILVMSAEQSRFSFPTPDFHDFENQQKTELSRVD